MHLTETGCNEENIRRLEKKYNYTGPELIPSPFFQPNFFKDSHNSNFPTDYFADELKYKSNILHFSNLKYPPDYSADLKYSNAGVLNSNDFQRWNDIPGIQCNMKTNKTNYNIDNILNSSNEKTDEKNDKDISSQQQKTTNSKLFKPYLDESNQGRSTDSRKSYDKPLQTIPQQYKLPSDILMDERNGIEGLLSLAKVANEQLGEELAKEKRKNKSNNSLHLWEFLLNLLENEERRPVSERCIEWTNKDIGEFRLMKTSVIATLWGKSKNRTNMTYEKMARAMRYYYKMKVLVKVPHKRLHFQFGPRMNIKLEHRHASLSKAYNKLIPSNLNIDQPSNSCSQNGFHSNDNDMFLHDLNTPIDDIKSPFHEFKIPLESDSKSPLESSKDFLNPFKTSIFFPPAPTTSFSPTPTTSFPPTPTTSFLPNPSTARTSSAFEQNREASFFPLSNQIFRQPTNATSVIIANGNNGCHSNGNL